LRGDVGSNIVRVSHERGFVVGIEIPRDEVEGIFFCSAVAVLPETERVGFAERVEVVGLHDLGFCELLVYVRTDLVFDHDWHDLFVLCKDFQCVDSFMRQLVLLRDHFIL